MNVENIKKKSLSKEEQLLLTTRADWQTSEEYDETRKRILKKHGQNLYKVTSSEGFGPKAVTGIYTEKDMRAMKRHLDSEGIEYKVTKL